MRVATVDVQVSVGFAAVGSGAGAVVVD